MSSSCQICLFLKKHHIRHLTQSNPPGIGPSSWEKQEPNGVRVSNTVHGLYLLEEYIYILSVS